MAVWRMANTPVNQQGSAMWSLANGDTVSPTTVAPGGANRCRRPADGVRPGPRRNPASPVRPLTCGGKTTPPPGRPPFSGSLPTGATHPRHRRRAAHPGGTTPPRRRRQAALPDGATLPRLPWPASLPHGATRRHRQARHPVGATCPRLLCPACLPDGATRPPLPCPACLTSGTGRRQPRSGSSQASGKGRDTAHRSHLTDRRTALTRPSRRFVPCRRVDLERPA
jgi:hypothetical protein